MKPKSTLPTITWVLLGVLIVAAFALSLGKSDDTALPSASSFSPSGTRAFSELLQRNGYDVIVTQNPSPRFLPKDVPLAFEVGGSLALGTDKTLARHANSNANSILLALDKDFKAASITAQDSLVDVQHSVATEPTKVNFKSSDLESVDGDSDAGQPVATSRGTTLATIKNVEGGKVLEIQDGIIATNRFLDKNDNAGELVRLVRMVAPKGSRLVFLEASFGNGSPPGVLETIGAWALVSWWQLIFLFVVIIYTLGKPFGYPDEERPVQRGARELVDAVAQTYRRARATHIALAAILSDADHELRRKLKLPFDTPRADRDRLIPPDLARALASVEVASQDRIGPSEALGLVTRLNANLREFIGERLLPRKRKKF